MAGKVLSFNGAPIAPLHLVNNAASAKAEPFPDEPLAKHLPAPSEVTQKLADCWEDLGHDGPVSHAEPSRSAALAGLALGTPRADRRMGAYMRPTEADEKLNIPHAKDGFGPALTLRDKARLLLRQVFDFK